MIEDLSKIPFRCTIEQLRNLDVQLNRLNEYYSSKIPSVITTQRKNINAPKFYTSGANLLSENEQITFIDSIAKERDLSIEKAYKKYVPALLSYRLKNILLFKEAFSCNKEGTIKIIIEKDFDDEINSFMKSYHYKLYSKELVKNNLTILKYKKML